MGDSPVRSRLDAFVRELYDERHQLQAVMRAGRHGPSRHNRLEELEAMINALEAVEDEVQRWYGAERLLDVLGRKRRHIGQAIGL